MFIGDLNVRHGGWDKVTKKKERAVMRHIYGTNYSILSPQGLTYRPRWWVGGSTPDVAVTDISEAPVIRVPEGVRRGAPDHEPIISTIGGEVSCLPNGGREYRSSE